MTNVPVAALQGPRIDTGRGVRALGLLGVLASPAFLVAWLAGGFGSPEAPKGIVALQLLFLVGWASCLVGMQRLGAAGGGKARRLLLLELFGVSLAMTQELQDLLLSAPNRTSVVYRVADAAWPISVLFMLVVGVATARSGVLPGWRRVAALACGLTLPLSLAIAAIAGRSAMGPAFGILTACAWSALGYAVATANPVGTSGEKV